ncbi:MAG: hypothetical protein PVJ86_13310 [Phycisphaerales bacterium]|jgi:hypothetical protein
MDTQDRKEMPQSERGRLGLDWNGWDVVFFVLPIMFTIFGRTAGYEYLRSNYSSLSSSFMTLMVYPAIGVFIIYCFFANVVRLLVSWTKHSRRKRILLAAEISTLIVIIVLFLASCFMPIDSHLWVPGYKPFTYHFGQEIRSKADIQAIRDWLRTLSKEDCTGETIRLGYASGSSRSQWPDSREWPESLQELHPNYVNLDLDEKGNPKIRLSWGRAHWGVEIGMEDMEIPPSDFSRWGEYRLPLEPGVYVWHELQ